MKDGLRGSIGPGNPSSTFITRNYYWRFIINSLINLRILRSLRTLFNYGSGQAFGKGDLVLHVTGYPTRSHNRLCNRHTAITTRPPPHGHRHMATAIRPPLYGHRYTATATRPPPHGHRHTATATRPPPHGYYHAA